MGVMRYLSDGLINALSGIGTSIDPTAHSRYCHLPLSDSEIDAAFRSSWLYRKIITKPATEMVREWRDWQTDKANIEKLEAEEKRLDVRAKFWAAERIRGLGGAGMVIYVDGDDQTTAIDPKRLRSGSLTALHVWHRSCFTLGEPIVDWTSDWFGHPSYYEVRLAGSPGQPVRFHPSRVIAFRGHPVGGVSSTRWQDLWWGESTVQVVKEAVDHVHTAEKTFAALLKDARNRRLYRQGLLELTATADGEARLSRRAQALATGENSMGITWLDSGGPDGVGGEKLEDRQMVWAGIPEIKASNLAVAAAAANMPATVLLGKSPDGMNSTGASDQQIWEQEVKSRQDLLMRPCIDQLDVALVPSALGKPDASIWWQYSPLSVQSEKDEATTFKTTMDAVAVVQNTGAVPEIAFEKAVQNLLEERGWTPGLGDALADLDEAERFPSLSQIDPNEADPNVIAMPQQRGGDPIQAGGGSNTPTPARRAANDAWMFEDWAAKPLYVRRDVLNRADIVKWAKSQGFDDIVPDLHVTITYSETPVDWMTMGESWRGKLEIEAGGPRLVEALGPDGKYKALLFTAYELISRNQEMRDKGASFSWAEYQPHISIQLGGDIDLAKVQPYTGKIVLGPEIFEEIRADGD